MSSHLAIDVHSHVVPAALYGAARRGETLFGMTLGFTDDGVYSWSAGGEGFSMQWDPILLDSAERLRSMDRDRIGVQLLSINPAMYGYSNSSGQAASLAHVVNDGIAELAAAAPDRFLGLAHLPMQDPKAAARELERAVTELGMVGAGIGTNVDGRDLDAPEFRPVFEALETLGVMLSIHPSANRFPRQGHPHYLQNLIGHPVETTVAMASLIFGRVFDQYPGLRVCFAHAGGYGCMAMGRLDHGYQAREQCREMARMPSEYRSQIYVDTLAHSHAALRLAVSELGVDQIVLGTDYPADMGQTDPIGWLEGAEWLTSDQRDQILSTNAANLLGSAAPAGLR